LSFILIDLCLKWAFGLVAKGDATVKKLWIVKKGSPLLLLSHIEFDIPRCVKDNSV
tara:strand:- start:1558 stop:1725 length:168 start_codon:yes stop_codon:yes gene_type:complete